MSMTPSANDNHYIGSNTNQEEIDKALFLGHRYRISEKNEQVNFPEAKKEYHIYIRMLSEILQELKLPNNPLYYSIILQRIIYRGFCSINKYRYEEDARDILNYTEGINVIAGEGVCRNSTAFIQDVLKKLDFPNERFYCNSNRTAYKRKIGRVDHVLNIITIDGVKYGYDSTNKMFLRFVNEFDLKATFPTGEQIIQHFKPYAALSSGDTLEEVKAKMETYHESSVTPQISEEEVNKIIVKSVDLVNKNEKMFKAFKEYTQERKEKILTLTQRRDY